MVVVSIVCLVGRTVVVVSVVIIVVITVVSISLVCLVDSDLVGLVVFMLVVEITTFSTLATCFLCILRRCKLPHRLSDATTNAKKLNILNQGQIFPTMLYIKLKKGK